MKSSTTSLFMCLVIGATGFIGNAIFRRLPATTRHGTFCSASKPDLMRLDICDSGATSALIRQLSPRVIFLPAALSWADACETDPQKCQAVNVLGVDNVARAAREVRAKLVYFSTDYVFDGQAGPYHESDEPRAINLLGKAKIAAENLIQNRLDDYLIVRVNGVYGWEERRKNFVVAMLDRLRKGQEMKVPIDQIGCPTFVGNVADAVLELVSLDQRGIFHVAGLVPLNRYAFACLVADVFELDKHLIVPVTTEKLGQIARRPLQGGLLADKVRSIVSTPLVAPLEGLQAMKEQGDPFAASAAKRL